MPRGVYDRSKSKPRHKHSEETKGKDILWLWDYEINDEWFDLEDYLEI